MILVGILVYVGSIIQGTVGFRNAYLAVLNFLSPKIENVASVNGRTNILIMGKAGGVHEGSDLTDTMIVASVSLGKPSVSLVSIPRDLWIPEIRAKVNSAYYWGTQREEGGIPYAKSIAEKIIGAPIHYGLVINFSAFRDIVDAIGGIEINVDRGFTDKLYPIEGKGNDPCGGDPSFACRYETVTFNPGQQNMNGETALKFVRSRMAEGEEGTDTAREARQQKVIGEIKAEVLSPRVYLNPTRILAVFNVFKNSSETDINPVSGAVIVRIVFDAGSLVHQFLVPDELLIHPPTSKLYDGQYVFIPKAGNGVWTEIKAWALEGPLSPGE